MKTNDQFLASLASVKGNFLTAFQPMYEAVIIDMASVNDNKEAIYYGVFAR